MSVQDFLLPDLGEGLTEGTVVAWLVNPGDEVAVDQPVAEVETAKAIVELPCPFAGTVEALHVQAGDELEVGGRLMSVLVSAPSSPSDAASRSSSAGDARGEGSGGADTAENGQEDRPLVGYGVAGLGEPRRRGRAAAPASGGRTADPPAPVGPAGQTRGEGDARSEPPRCKPHVRKLAKDLGVDLWKVAATGPNGTVTDADVRAAATAGERDPAPQAHAAAGSSAAVPTGEASRRSSLDGVRRRVADKLAQSRREIPHATTFVDCDVTDLMAVRAELQEAFGELKISPLAVILRACTAALERFPVLNSTFDAATNEIVHHDAIHLGIATETDRGLLVPVIRDAGGRSIKDLAVALGQLAERARSGTISPAELTGGTFTVSNYGWFGADSGEAIINHPQVAILGMGRIAARPWVVEDEVRVRQTCQLSMSFDHRACDGGEPARFLRLLASYLESRTALLGGL